MLPLTKEQKDERKKLRKIDLEYQAILNLIIITWNYKSLNPDTEVDYYLRNNFIDWYDDNKCFLNLSKKAELKDLCSIVLWDASVNHLHYKTAINWFSTNEFCKEFFNRFIVSTPK